MSVGEHWALQEQKGPPKLPKPREGWQADRFGEGGEGVQWVGSLAPASPQLGFQTCEVCDKRASR